MIEAVARRLGRVRSAIRALFVLDWVGRTLAFGSLFLAGLFLIDYTVILPFGLRMAFEAAAATVLAYLAAARLIRPLLLEISDDDLALLVEREYPHLRDRLISAVQLSRQKGAWPLFNSPELVDLLVGEASREAESLNFRRALSPRFAVRPFLAGIASASALVVGAALEPELAGIFLKRLVGEARWPAETDLIVEGFASSRRLVVPKGDDVTITVTAKRKRPRKVVLHYEFRKVRETGSETMTPLLPDKFRYVFRQVVEPFTFTVSSRDLSTDEYAVDVLDPPELRNPSLYFSYPPYLRWKDTPEQLPETNPNVKVPLFTRVRFTAVATDDLAQAEFWLGPRGKEAVQRLEILPDSSGRRRTVEARFAVDSEHSEYMIRVKSVKGLWSRDPMRYSIRGIPDQKPSISVLRPRSMVEEITKDCLKKIELAVEDDYGIREIRMFLRVVADQAKPDWMPPKIFGERELSPPRYGEKRLRVADVLEVAALAVKEKDAVEIRFEAQDYKDVGDPNITSKGPYQLRIVSVVDLEAKLEGEIERLKGDLKRLLSRQRVLLNRTEHLKGLDAGRPDLTLEQRAEIRDLSVSQNEITSKLESAARDLEVVSDRGIENRIFDERSAGALQKAVDLLASLTTTATNPPGASYDAAQKLMGASRAQARATREANFAAALGLQEKTYDYIDQALDALDRWATFQEAVRIAREAHARERDLRKKLEEMRACPQCKIGNCPIHR